MKIELKQLGDTVAVVLPDELAIRLGLTPGVEVTLSELPDGRLVLTPAATHCDRVKKIGREVFAEYQDTFKALAK